MTGPRSMSCLRAAPLSQATKEAMHNRAELPPVWGVYPDGAREAHVKAE